MSQKILLARKEQGRENRKSEEKETRRSKKSNGCTPSSYVDFFEDSKSNKHILCIFGLNL